jgi:putative ATP-binding cassette transporter
VSFISVLWVLSNHVVFGSGDATYTVPGYMVWCALGYALTGSWLTWRVGRPLIHINAERYAREAKLRFAFVRVDECAEAPAQPAGEADERLLLNATAAEVVGITTRLAGGLARLTWITSGYGWLAIVAPVLVAAPGYFHGSMSFGGLMMVVGAFNQVQQALRWFVDNFSRIADWRATLLRVVSFRRALVGLEEDVGTGGNIRRGDAPAPRLVLERLSVALVEGRAWLDAQRVEVEPGDRVLIVGEPGVGKSTLFRAIAGLWPWGGGSLELPPRGAMMFMPHRPYLPPGTLRAAITYPAATDLFAAADVAAALERLGLGRLIPLLDRERRWDRELSLDDQQRLAFVRVLLHAPGWVFLDDAMGALSDEHRRVVLGLFAQELAETAVVGISRDTDSEGFYTRTYHLRRQDDVPPAFLPLPEPSPVPVPSTPALAEASFA